MSSLYTLDIGKSTGRAYFGGPAALPKCATWRGQKPWRNEEYAPYFVELEDWFISELGVFKPDRVGFESPVLVASREGRGSDEDNCRRLIGAAAVIELACARRSIACHEVHVQNAKSFMGVPGRRPQGMSDKDYKDLMTIIVTNMGYSVADSHQADAVAVARVIYFDLGLIDE